MDGSTGNINQIIPLNVDPVQQIFRTVLLNTLFQLFATDTRFQSERNLRARLSVGHIPAFGLAPRLPHTLGAVVIRMDLHGKLFVGKQKLQKQWKALWIAGGFANEFNTELLANLRQRLA